VRARIAAKSSTVARLNSHEPVLEFLNNIWRLGTE